MTKARDLANASTALSAVSPTELGYLDGVTSAVQTQLNAKQPTVSGVSDTEIGYLDGVTSAIQTQLDAKVSTAGGSTIAVASGTTVPLTITNEGTGNSFVVQDSANPDSTPFVIDNSGAVAMGSGTPVGKLYVAAENATATVVSAKVGTSPGGAFLTRSANGTLTTPTISVNGDVTGQVAFQGYDGTTWVSASSITGVVDGTPGTGDMPGRLMFNTTPDGGSTNIERMRISATGNVDIGSNASSNVNGLRYFDLFNQDGTTSGSGSIIRLITQQSGSTNLTSVDLVKYKNGTFVIQNNDTAGTLSLGTGTGSDLTIAADGATTVSYTTTTGRAVRNIYMSTSDPSGGSDGDVWIKYT